MRHSFYKCISLPKARPRMTTLGVLASFSKNTGDGWGGWKPGVGIMLALPFDTVATSCGPTPIATAFSSSTHMKYWSWVLATWAQGLGIVCYKALSAPLLCLFPFTMKALGNYSERQGAAQLQPRNDEGICNCLPCL